MHCTNAWWWLYFRDFFSCVWIVYRRCYCVVVCAMLVACDLLVPADLSVSLCHSCAAVNAFHLCFERKLAVYLPFFHLFLAHLQSWTCGSSRRATLIVPRILVVVHVIVCTHTYTHQYTWAWLYCSATSYKANPRQQEADTIADNKIES